MSLKSSHITIFLGLIALLASACQSGPAVAPISTMSTAIHQSSSMETVAAPAADASLTPLSSPTSGTIPTPLSPICVGKANMIQQACTNSATGFQYWAYLPPKIPGTSVPKLPLLVYLHGFSHSGSDLNLLLAGGVPAEIENGRALPMMVISPQCPRGENWQSPKMVERISQLIDEVVAGYHLDPRQIYLTGFSMGGDGVWAAGQAHPEQFAALLPVSSDWIANDPSDICVVQNIPIWVFQSEEDELVAPWYAKNNVAAIQQCGGEKIQFTLFPDGNHEETSRRVYEMDEVYQWFLEQK